MVGQILRLVDSVRKGLFIVGTALLIFVAARNTITWHMQRFWGASGDFWQKQWKNIYQLCGSNSFILGVFGTTLFGFVVFWLSNAFLLVLDVTGKPATLLRYKVQPDKNVPVSKDMLRSAVELVLFNQVVVGIPVAMGVHWMMEWRGCSLSPDDLPTFHWALLELIICVLVEEIGFYYSHRVLHHPRLYKHVHKKHHEWTAPIGIVALYAHPVEHVLSNLLPPALGPVILGSHLATAWMWFALALMSTTVAHCGYHFPFLPSPEAHDYHHLKFNQNYGVLGVLDRLHGTDNQFRASKAYQRHFLLLGFIPMSQQFPDQPSKSKSE
ncbi:fatty acid hydroxylase domain-containing protein 2-like [Babylonia areolata]|uniref:fatty acid hydroxylase domain-containing protein 2-like n=1 Tax=Babylonia areolata TaxID=304850 RepID=UPI003FD2E12D